MNDISVTSIRVTNSKTSNNRPMATINRMSHQSAATKISFFETYWEIRSL